MCNCIDTLQTLVDGLQSIHIICKQHDSDECSACLFYDEKHDDCFLYGDPGTWNLPGLVNHLNDEISKHR